LRAFLVTFVLDFIVGGQLNVFFLLIAT